VRHFALEVRMKTVSLLVVEISPGQGEGVDAAHVRKDTFYRDLPQDSMLKGEEKKP